METSRYLTLAALLFCGQAANLAGSQAKSRSCFSWLVPRWLSGQTNNSSQVAVDEERKESKYRQAIRLNDALKKECRLVSQATKEHAQIIMDLTGLYPELAAIVLGYTQFKGVCKGGAGRFSGEVFDLTVLPNNILASTAANEITRLWDIGSWQCRIPSALETMYITVPKFLSECSLLFSSKKTALGSGKIAYITSVWSGKRIEISNASDGTCLHKLSGHNGYVNCLAVLRNGNLISGSDDNDLRIWDPSSGQSLHVLKGHKGSVNVLAILPDGNIVSGSSDNTIKIWDPITVQCLATLADHTGGVTCLAVLPDGNIASGSRDCTFRVWE